MKGFLLIALLAVLCLLAASAKAQNSFPMDAQNIRVTAYKKGNNGVWSRSNYVQITPIPQLWVPNAFTPNGDGVNETFVVKGENLRDFNLLIFNRWGELVYQTTDMNAGWDGTYKGQPCQSDVYVYKVAAKGQTPGSLFNKEGTVALID